MNLIARTMALTVVVALIPFPAGAVSEQINEDGFGNPSNEYTWAMYEFEDDLYVGTQNSVDGGEIWRYAPEHGWEMLVSGGLGNPKNMGVRWFVEFNGELYATTNNHFTGGEIWRMRQEPTGPVWEHVIKEGFGHPDNTSVRGLAVYDGYLYAGTYNFPTGCEVWRSPDGDNWERILYGGFGSANNFAAAVMAVNEGSLYVGTWNIEEGLEVWRWNETDGWRLVSEHGFGKPKNWNAVSMVEYEGKIYVGTGNLSGNGAEVWRYDEGSGWEKIGPGGFGNPYNFYHWYMYVHDGRLYVGTCSAKWFGFDGHELWSFSELEGWIQVAKHGFGERNNYGLRSMVTYRGDLYIGTANTLPGPFFVEGCEVWRYDPEMIHANLYPNPRKATMNNAFFFGRYMKVEVILPCGYDVGDIDAKDLEIIKINGVDVSIEALSYFRIWNRYFAFFQRSAVEPLLWIGNNQISIVGLHGTGEVFGGTGQLIIDPG